MPFEVTPEPSAEELRALQAALGPLESARGGASGAYESVWRLAGLLENVESGGAGASPAAGPEGRSRSSDGANRA